MDKDGELAHGRPQQGAKRWPWNDADKKGRAAPGARRKGDVPHADAQHARALDRAGFAWRMALLKALYAVYATAVP